MCRAQGREHAGGLQFVEDVGDRRLVEHTQFLRVAEDERGVADDVEDAGYAAAPRVNQVGRGARELQRYAQRCATESMIDVVTGLVRGQRRQMVADGNPLAELLQRRRRELVAQVGLAD